jgi:hypothetical protein
MWQFLIGSDIFDQYGMSQDFQSAFAQLAKCTSKQPHDSKCHSSHSTYTPRLSGNTKIHQIVARNQSIADEST